MYIEINRSVSKAIWLQIVDQIIDFIMSGQLSPGDPLVPSRQLASMLGVSRSTVQLAYEELQSRGYVTTSRRGGTKVCQIMPDETKAENQKTIPPIPVHPLLEEKDQVQYWPKLQTDKKPSIDFRLHEPYIDATFKKAWRKAFNIAVKSENVLDWGYSSPYGLPSVREEISRYLAIERGIYVEPNQILLTLGARQTMDLIAQALLQEGDTVAVEDPGFPVAWSSMRYRKMDVQPIPVDDQGICVDQLPSEAKVIFTTPSHQFPSGVLMSANRKQALIQFATEQRAWIIEDDYDSEYRYRGGPIPSLYSQLPSNILYFMSFSKLLAPGIRLAAIIGPETAIARLAKVQEYVCRHLPIMEQLTLGQFFASGDLLKHVRRMRAIYHKRHQDIVNILASSALTNTFKIQGKETGLHILLEGNEDFDEQQAVKAALEAGIGVFPLSPYCLESKRKGLLLGFAHLQSEQIIDGINRLADALQEK
ncbi:PLP-dependent aminotransferase family protein [Caldibacillus lycopersici]|uniref:PLP-dependent aminotransferase family protein n=1 Tax=Perspicuibacillus lycopersici TaxID=1325689 RepID=A0AAE3IVQ1_9BACI|nr:PLP-dependent aminotransferase family protein [Perspicuibacillus lycopersici]MCU9612945.1 PLP-dependent aminotransferase family protein [Perspicuibacillus lycopersici]